VTAGVSAAIPAVALEAAAGPQIGADPVLAQDHGIARGQNQSLNPALHVVIDEDPGAGVPGLNPDPDRVVPAGVGVRAALTGALTITMMKMDTGSMLPIWIAMLVKGTWKSYLANTDP